jgi:hypothetical protein
VERTARAMKPLAAALAVGAAAGFLLVLARTPRYRFLPHAHRVTLQEQTDDGVRTTLARFVASESPQGILDRLRKESPMRLERETEVAGRRGWVITIPRTDGERADLSFPPAREVTILEGSPSAVEVREYRTTGAFDTFVEWVRRPLRA